MPLNPNATAPRISLGNWISGGSLLYIPPDKNKKLPVAKAKPSPKKVEAPKEEKKDEAPKSVSEGTDSPEDVLKKAREIVAKAEADAKKAEEEQKKMEEVVAKKKADEEAATKKADEEAATKKADEKDVAEKKGQEEAAAKKKAEEEEEAERKKKIEELAKAEQEAQKIFTHGRFCSLCGRRRHEGKCDDSPIKTANSNPVINVNVYAGSDDAAKVTGDKNVTTTTTSKKADDGATAAKAEDKEKSDTLSIAKPGDNSKFTKNQDEEILSMKKACNSWKQISMALGLEKKAVIERFKELSDDKVSTSGSDKESSLPEGHVDVGEIAGMLLSLDVDAKKDDAKKDDAKKEDTPKDGDGDKSKNQKKKGNSNSSENSKKGGNYKKPTVEDANKKSETPKKDDSNKSDTKKDEDEKPDYRERPDEPRTYVPISFAATIPLSNGRRHLEPDATWTIKDLECLAEIECRYRELKWLHLSAQFFNMTGRQIHPDLIRAKVMEAPLPEEYKKGGQLPDVLNSSVNLNDLQKQDQAH